MDKTQAILETFDQYAQAYCAKDVEGLMALFIDGEDISIIGTGADELCAGRYAIEKLFERNFAEATAKSFEWHWQHVTASDHCAVVATTLTIHLDTDGGPLDVPLRWTVALKKDADRWCWLHRHASAAAMQQDEGTAYPTEN